MAVIKLVKIGDIVATNASSYSTKDNWGYVNYLDTGNITQNIIDSIQYIDLAQEKLPSRAKRKVRENSIVYSTVRPNQLHYGIIRNQPKNFLVSTGFTVIDVDESKAVAEYVYYFLTQKEIVESLQAIGEQSVSTYPSIKPSDIEDIEIPLPTLDIQKKIVGILKSLDAKIESNSAINNNLEQQAMAYYRELFVLGAKTTWRIGTISDLGSVVGGSTPSKAKEEYYTDSGIAWITPKDLSNDKSKYIYHGENDITELGLKNSSAIIMPKGTVLFSSRAPIGYIAIAGCSVTTNQGFKSVIPKPEIGTAFIYYFLKDNLPIIEGMASGSTFKEVSGSTMKNVPAIIPDKETLAIFNEFCAPIFEQQRVLESETRSLIEMRDGLLVKLMSGEIDVSTLEI